jgi:single-strand DNA-binding protein
MNKAMLIGRLGKDPELRHTANGTPIANMRIATDESYTDRDGNKVDRTEWHTVVVFNRPAENCQDYLKKGSLVWVEGSLQTRKWQDQQGQDRYATEIKASRVIFLDSKNQQKAKDRPEPGNEYEDFCGTCAMSRIQQKNPGANKIEDSDWDDILTSTGEPDEPLPF